MTWVGIPRRHTPDENEFFHADDEVPPLESEETNVQTHQLQNT